MRSAASSPIIRIGATSTTNSKQQKRDYSTTCPSVNFSRMLDMGGAPSGATANKNNIRVRNTSKNSKVQGVAFDFELLVQAMASQEPDITAPSPQATATTKLATSATIQPNVAQVQEVANLLGITRSKSRSEEEDDLTALLGGATEQKDPMKQARNAPPSAPVPPLPPPPPPPTTTTNNPIKNSGIPKSLQDIRSKYANKLHKKGVEGGLAGVDLANYQKEEGMKRGDAEGHLSARKLALSQPTAASGEGGGQSGTRWMALTGTGKLLSTLTYRSMKIALLPRANNNNNNTNNNHLDSLGRTPNERMVDLTRQLKDVVFDVLVDLPVAAATNDSPTSDQQDMMVQTMVASTLEQLALEPNVILFVSDQDAYLKAAKDLGMMTCRVRPLNARRGNVSAHHTVESILQVEDVVNEMNGISFNAVLNM